ncbi:MAG: hypothetical protein R3C39_08315 [Dehalococcoidia bacterium]
MSDSELLDLAFKLWPDVRDRGVVGDPSDLDRLLAAQGLPGAPGFDCGVRDTFGCFAPDQDASDFALPTGERPRSDEEGRFIAHVLVTRVLLGAGLGVDPRVTSALCATYALSWTATGGDYRQSPLALATTLWLPALDADASSDRPLPIDWSAACYQDEDRWDLDYRLFSRYDIRERALDWAVFVSSNPARHEGVSMWTIVEPLLRMERDGRAELALGQYADAADEVGSAPAPAAAMLERTRVAASLRAYLASVSGPRRLRASD